jgi:hypothetical protein
MSASMSSSGTRNPESVVADADGLARKVAAIRAAGAAKLQVRFLAKSHCFLLLFGFGFAF